MDHAAWVLDQVRALRPETSARTWASIQDLVGALTTLRRPKEGAQLFGLSANHVSADHRPAVEAGVIDALVAWKAKLETNDDVVTLLELDKAARRLDVPALKLDKRFPLRCDPLGTRNGLAAEWLRRLERLDEAIAGRRLLDARAVEIVGAVDGNPTAEFGAPDEHALYERALRHETARRETFPRELAALWSTANGISFDGTPFLRDVRSWDDDDHGLCIGSGGYAQGSLTIEVTKKSGLLAAKVVDRDDDGVVRTKHANIGALLDALLG